MAKVAKIHLVMIGRDVKKGELKCTRGNSHHLKSPTIGIIIGANRGVIGGGGKRQGIA